MSLYPILKDGRINLKEVDLVSSSDEVIIYDDTIPKRVSIRKLRGTGWAFYDDSQYTSGSPLNVNNETKQITINGFGAFTETRFLPSGIQDLWSNNKILPENVGDTYSIRLDLTAVPSNNADKFTVLLDIGNPSGNIILNQTFEINKAIGTPETFAFDSELYAIETFVLNGGALYIQTDNDIDFYNIGLLIKRDHKEA